MSGSWSSCHGGAVRSVVFFRHVYPKLRLILKAPCHTTYSQRVVTHTHTPMRPGKSTQGHFTIHLCHLTPPPLSRKVCRACLCSGGRGSVVLAGSIPGNQGRANRTSMANMGAMEGCTVRSRCHHAPCGDDPSSGRQGSCSLYAHAPSWPAATQSCNA